MAALRVLVVEDSLTARRRLCDALARDPELVVAGEAVDAESAVAMCARLRPDVVTLDMVLPGHSGLWVAEQIMAYTPTPILVVSSATNRGEAHDTFAALSAGAVDVLEKPRGNEPEGEWERTFRERVRRVARIRVITHPRARLRGGQPAPAIAPANNTFVATRSHSARARIVAVGASTGGPAAVTTLLRGLGQDFPLPLLLVMHLEPRFAAPFTAWLASQSPLPVATAVHGEVVPSPGAGRVLIAPADRHLIVRDGRLLLSDAPERHSCRPSVDALFESLAESVGPSAVGCVLTGMGRDGAAGLLAMRRAGCPTFAQDEATSAIFGMPREAITLGGAERVLALDEFAPALAALARGGAREVSSE